jgi:hypothetical protein
VSSRTRHRKSGECVGAGDPEWLDIDLHEVRLDLLEVDRHTGRVERFGERPRSRVIVRQPPDVVVERVHARGGDDSRLAHGATHEVLLAPGTFHQLTRACEERAQRAAEPLREAERNGVEPARDLGR